MSRQQQSTQHDLARSGRGQSAPAPALEPSLTAAHFTERELHELRKACRDLRNSGEGSELAGKFLEAAIARAKGAK